MASPASAHHRMFQSSRLMAFIMLSVGVHAGVLLSTDPAPPLQGVENGSLQVRLEPGKTVEPPVHPPSDVRTDPSPEQTANNTEATSSPEPEPDQRDINPDPIQTTRQTEISSEQTPKQDKTELSEKTEPTSPTRFDQVSRVDHDNRVQSRVRARLQESLKLYLEYPEMARRRGWEGEVTVSLRLTRKGEIMDVALSKSSGHRILDNNTLRTLKNLPRLEGADSMLDSKGITIQLPVIYQLSRI